MTSSGSPSLRARALARTLAPVGQVLTRRLFARPPRFPIDPVRPLLGRWCDVSEAVVGDGTVTTATPRDGGAGAGHLVYLHGGAYTMPGFHWPMLLGLVRRGWTVSAVDYPLAPEHTVDETVPMVVDAWRLLASSTDGAPLCLGGDSAGAGLALVLLTRLRDRDLPRPAATALLSPWVDLDLADDATIAAATDDPLLSRSGLLTAARLYAGGRPLDDPWLSPVNADLADLGPVRAWIGTRDQFLPQNVRLAERAREAPGTELRLDVVPGMVHDWPLFPIPEQRTWLDAAAAFLADPSLT